MTSAQSVEYRNAPAEKTRRRLLPVVDSRFQWKYTLIITGLGVGLTSVMGWFLYSAHRENTGLLELDGNLALQEQLMRNDQIFLLYLLVLVAAMAIALAFWGLVVTHRISGPLYILARYLNTMAAGHYPDLRPLRKRDELHEFFSAFEEAVHGFKRRDQQALMELEAAVEELKELAENDPKGAAERAGKVLRRQAAQLKETLEG